MSTKQGQESEAAFLRRLAQEKRDEIERIEREGTETDKLWRKKREEYAPKAVEAIRDEVMRRAREAAKAGATRMTLDLGVDEGRLRATSQKAALELAAAVLSTKGLVDRNWRFANRVGWTLQTADGMRLMPEGQRLIEALRELGLTVRFVPYHIQDNYSEPFVNASLEIEW